MTLHCQQLTIQAAKLDDGQQHLGALRRPETLKTATLKNRKIISKIPIIIYIVVYNEIECEYHMHTLTTDDPVAVVLVVFLVILVVVLAVLVIWHTLTTGDVTTLYPTLDDYKKSCITLGDRS